MTNFATADQLGYLERTLDRHKLYTGHYDRLWKILRAARLYHDTSNNPAAVELDGSPLSFDKANEIIAWVDRQLGLGAGAPQPAHRHAADANGNCQGCGVEMFDANLRRVAAPRDHRRPYPQVDDGYYAVDSATGNNDTDFYRVERKPGRGKWAGRTFTNVSRVIGGHCDTQVRGPDARAALERILAAGMVAARERFARELESCWKCNIHLTDDLSRLLLIGPDCCKAVYGMTQVQLRDSRAAA